MKDRIEPIVGRYIHVDVLGETCRIHFEECGQGIPLLCLHTAGSDGRQFRHLLNDDGITDRFRVIAFDMPWHGKSYPPVGFHERDYELTTERYVATIRAFSAALGLDRPVVMGCSIGGRIVLQLAHAHGAEFRALIGLESADHQQPWYDTSWLNRPDVHGGEVCAALVSGLVAPQSPDEYRHETLWQYKQGGPGIFKGDLYFYRVDSDLRGKLDKPVVMGCSIGGRIVLQLAHAHGAEFRALIGLESADHQQPWYDTGWLNRPDVHGGEVCAALVSGLIAPQSPSEYRHETLWQYKQSGPGIFKGDLYFYRVDSDLRGKLDGIDTATTPLYLLTGEYDFSCSPEDSIRTAETIPGATVTVMKELGHFPMSENPAQFRKYILPVLDEIAAL